MTLYKRIANDFRISGGILLILFICAYWIPLRSTVVTWINNDDYSYGCLVPFISAYLFWDMRERLNGLQFKTHWWSLPPLIVMVVISLYGILGSSGNIAKPALPILIILFFVFYFGKEAFRRFCLPICFLIFLAPLPDFIDLSIGVFLKKISSELGGMVIRTSGLSVYVNGNIIDLGVAKLQVIDACSGLRFLFPLIAAGVLFSYFFETVYWKRFVCIVATIPIAIIANGLRIGITGILTEFFGITVAKAFFHSFSGWAVFIFAVGILLVLEKMVGMLPPKKVAKPYSFAKKKVERRPVWAENNWGLGISVVLLVGVGVLSATTQAMPDIKIKGSFKGLPKTIKQWQGQSSYIEPEIIRESGAQDAYAATYQNNEEQTVSLYIGYRESAFLEIDNFFHSPAVCLPAGGWKTVSKNKHAISKIPFGKNFCVTQMVVEQMSKRQLVYFWFQTKDKSTFSKTINRFHLAWHAIQNDNTHDLFIRLMTPIRSEESIAAAQARLDQFAQEMMNVLLEYLDKNQYIAY